MRYVQVKSVKQHVVDGFPWAGKACPLSRVIARSVRGCGWDRLLALSLSFVLRARYMAGFHSYIETLYGVITASW